nr:MAG TPA: NapC/NirT cytochrome c family, N-terminal region [Caudoviricetes sp.]
MCRTFFLCFACFDCHGGISPRPPIVPTPGVQDKQPPFSKRSVSRRE